MPMMPMKLDEEDDNNDDNEDNACYYGEDGKAISRSFQGGVKP